MQATSDIFLGWARGYRGYLGNGKVAIEAITAFAEAYADQNEADYAAFRSASTTVAWRPRTVDHGRRRRGGRYAATHTLRPSYHS